MDDTLAHLLGEVNTPRTHISQVSSMIGMS